jgi:hypothetical protein
VALRRRGRAHRPHLTATVDGMADYEAILAALVAENDARADRTWEPDTPEYAAERTEITEALLDGQLAIMART